MLPPRTKAVAHRLLIDVAAGAGPATAWHGDATAETSHPWGRVEGLGAIAALWVVLREALPDMERRDLIIIGGENRDDPRHKAPRYPHLVAALGHYQGTFAADLLDIPATHGVVHLRFAEAHFVEGDRIRWSRFHWDLLDLMRQAGVWPLPPSPGAEGMWPGPATQNGLRLSDAPWDGPNALGTVFAMHDALLSFDGTPESMDHAKYWTKTFMYYAGAGIGACRGLHGFRMHHQYPFLRAFPDRTAEGHFIRVSDGPFAVTGGTVLATHKGAYLGMTATGRRVRIPVMDFYRLEGARIAENWLPIDIPYLAYQLGNDVFARLRHMRGRADPEL